MPEPKTPLIPPQPPGTGDGLTLKELVWGIAVGLIIVTALAIAYFAPN